MGDSLRCQHVYFYCGRTDHGIVPMCAECDAAILDLLHDAERRLQVASQKLRERAALEWRAGTESNELHDWLRELAAALDAPGAK